MVTTVLAAVWGALLTATLPAFAQGPGWTVPSTVADLVVTASGGTNVRLTPDLTGCEAQSGNGPVYASIYPTHPGITRIKADLLAAFTTGAQVALYLSDNERQIGETPHPLA
jgi:hypothetical protein